MMGRGLHACTGSYTVASSNAGTGLTRLSMAGACTGIHRLTRASEFRACVSFGDTSRCRAVGRQADMFALEWRQALTGWYPVPSSTRADSNTYMKLRARSHERPMTMKCWLWCQRKVCNDDADSYFTPVVAYRPALVCRKASRLGHARTSRSPCHSSPSRPAPKRLPSPDAPQSPLSGLNRKDYGTARSCHTASEKPGFLC